VSVRKQPLSFARSGGSGMIVPLRPGIARARRRT
jgi:hypothetical protein